MCEHELPDEFLIQEAENGDRVESADGEVEYVVLVDEYSGERRTVRADAVEWSAWHEHPIVQAAAAMTAIMGLFIGVLYGGGLAAENIAAHYEPTEAEVWRLTYGWGIFVGMSMVFTIVVGLGRTRAQWWLYRWEKYAQNRHDLKRARKA